ncbi:unnamed protein product [Prorocentrum cordatum]|uniref:Uncharacterized protein n=1 Tax=Prorocentrum cordatum TaxID=2364126 RepID=A0ABN9VM31_9DINO|nr:unnamed protein product [Polarella glacialis]
MAPADLAAMQAAWLLGRLRVVRQAAPRSAPGARRDPAAGRRAAGEEESDAGRRPATLGGAQAAAVRREEKAGEGRGQA